MPRRRSVFSTIGAPVIDNRNIPAKFAFRCALFYPLGSLGAAGVGFAMLIQSQKDSFQSYWALAPLSSAGCFLFRAKMQYENGDGGYGR